VDRPAESQYETYNPWSIVNLVFNHLAREGLHPALGEGGDPGAPAAELLRAMGITPAPEGNRQVAGRVHEHLAEIRDAVFGELGPYRPSESGPPARRAAGSYRRGPPAGYGQAFVTG
jgi:hypothetical protein